MTLGVVGQPDTNERRPTRTLTDYQQRRIEACACGGWISAVDEDWVLIRDAVRRHQETLRHRNWWLSTTNPHGPNVVEALTGSGPDNGSDQTTTIGAAS